ncbi:MAG: DUF4011 domain-containing protein, partial [Planctomycetes bacterium]|nr:DUF4011 domain-containing protein [Planctomycetota bacterium]
MSDALTIEPLEVDVQHAPRLCLAMARCGVPLVEVVRVSNPGPAPLDGLALRLELRGAPSDEARAALPPLLPGGDVVLDRVDVRPAAGWLEGLGERVALALAWTVEREGDPLAAGEAPVTALPWREWPGEAAPPELLAAFVLPDHPAVARLAEDARARLTDPADDAPPRARARAVVRAACEALAALAPTVEPPPPDLAREGAVVRLPDEVVAARRGTSLDLALLLAACLERLGLPPLVVVLDDRALAGAWLHDDPVGLLGGVAEDAARLRTLRALEQVVVVDAPAPAAGASFDEALARGDAALADDARFRFALDVQALRDPRHGYPPLPLPEIAPPIAAAAALDAAVVAASAPTAPVGRFRRWQDRLLDLTRRNRLLSFSLGGRGALALEVPDLAAFEDRLARGEAFDLVPRPAGAARPADVDPAAVQAARRADLARGRLHVGLLADDLLARGRHLLREARTGQEEGGVTTLYVAVGLLRWVDEEGAPRLAPLVLYPAALELDRRLGALRLRRLVDEDPLGNVTLREKVRQDHGLDLSVLDAPPTDEHGLDVPALLGAVREAIRQRPGWEVLDEAHLGLFTFRKFLMWRDLAEHQAALLSSDAVRRIAAVDGPAALAAAAGAEVDAATLPLVVDGDATQSAAVASALGGRSFVLQGPPGTGKSQTITNLIAAALAAGKTVLFVSEKMAALEVVHRRLEAVGLGDFCLELHSHKASKKDVLRSLGRALERAERQGAVPWEERGRALAALRADLDAYARALHAPRPSGFSFHEARARLLALTDAPTLELDRTPDAPGRALAARAHALGAADLEAMRAAVASLAERARAHGRPGEHPLRECGLVEWSEARQRALGEALDDALAAAERVDAAAAPLLDRLGGAPASVGAPASGGAPASTDALVALTALCATLAGGAPPAALLRDDAPARAVATEAERHAQALEAQAARRADLARRWRDDLLAADLAPLAARFERWKGSWGWVRWLFLGGARRALRPLAAGDLPDDAQVARDLALALEVRREDARL